MLDRFLAVRRATPQQLRQTIDAMPLNLRIAMLHGVRHDHIIVGAYTDDHTGMCPMLAAHRRGVRVSFPTFAKVWDAFAGAPRRGHRPADPGDLHHLASALRQSIETELRASIEPTAPRERPSEHQAHPYLPNDHGPRAAGSLATAP